MKTTSTSIRAVAYARYSSTMQNEKSVDSQFAEISRYAERNGVEIVRKFADHAKSGASDHDCREEFWKAVEEAKNDPTITMFVVSDSSRFFRDRFMALNTKRDLMKSDVMVEYATAPLPEDEEQRLWVDGINELKDQAYSITVGKHTLRGQKFNAQQRDPETGFTYKNGGQTPYGYKGVKVQRGKDRFGKTVTKLLWVPDEETSRWYRYIKVTCRIERRMSYSEIAEELNAKGVPTTRGGLWTKTVVSLICANLTYTGQLSSGGEF